MELTELSLAPTHQFLVDKSSNSSSSESENNISSSSSSSSRKRKFFSADNHLIKTTSTTNGLLSVPTQTSVDLHVKDPLPLDWEQCLDLESGRMYYLNRKTLRKSWNWPKDQKLDLELNISPLSDHHQCIISSSNNNSSSLEEDHHYYSSKTKDHHQSSPSSTNSNDNNSNNNNNNNNNNMVALACLNCHLLVILSKSSPSCPNCKYVHSLPTTPQPKISPLSNTTTTNKSLNTLSLLN